MSQGRPQPKGVIAGRSALERALSAETSDILTIIDKEVEVAGVVLQLVSDGAEPIAARLSLRQRIFCETIVRTLDPVAARAAAGYTDRQPLGELISLNMEAYIEELLRVKMEGEGITEEHITTRINDLYFACLKGGTPQHFKVALECMKELARHKGMTSDPDGGGGKGNQFNFMFGTPPPVGP